jgi:hypothetical protein
VLRHLTLHQLVGMAGSFPLVVIFFMALLAVFGRIIVLELGRGRERKSQEYNAKGNGGDTTVNFVFPY